jgi:diguanylate cyclase (GGDEF)-like protein
MEFNTPSTGLNKPRRRVSDQQALISSLNREVAELRKEVARLSAFRTMAYRDPLTGLYNRRYLQERLAEECARTSRDSDYEFAMVMIDVDNFKSINDTYGHTEGDQILKDVANFLEDSVRTVDLCCRMGGDEFAILLPCTGEEEMNLVIQRINQAQKTSGLKVTMSVGGGSTHTQSHTTQSIFQAADEAMYSAKRARKGSSTNCD